MGAERKLRGFNKNEFEIEFDYSTNFTFNLLKTVVIRLKHFEHKIRRFSKLFCSITNWQNKILWLLFRNQLKIFKACLHWSGFQPNQTTSRSPSGTCAWPARYCVCFLVLVKMAKALWFWLWFINCRFRRGSRRTTGPVLIWLPAVFLPIPACLCQQKIRYWQYSYGHHQL